MSTLCAHTDSLCGTPPRGEVELEQVSHALESSSVVDAAYATPDIGSQHPLLMEPRVQRIGAGTNREALQVACICLLAQDENAQK